MKADDPVLVSRPIHFLSLAGLERPRCSLRREPSMATPDLFKIREHSRMKSAPVSSS